MIDAGSPSVAASSATAGFRRQHADLAGLAAAVLSVLDDPKLAGDSRAVRRSLAVLAGKLKVHAAMEDQALYPRLYGHADPAIRDLARRFRAEFGGVYASFLAFLAEWDAPAIEGRPSEFRTAARAAMSALGTRVRLENDELYDAVDEAEQRG